MRKIIPQIIVLLVVALLSPVLTLADATTTNSFITPTSETINPATTTVFVSKPGFWSREKTALTNRLSFWRNKFAQWGNIQAVGYSKMMGSNLETSIIFTEDYYLSVENFTTSSPLTLIQKNDFQSHLNLAKQAIEKSENNLIVISARNKNSKPVKSEITLNQLKELVKNTINNIRLANKEIGLAHDIVRGAGK